MRGRTERPDRARGASHGLRAKQIRQNPEVASAEMRQAQHYFGLVTVLATRRRFC